MGIYLGNIHSKPPTPAYEETWERCFGKKDCDKKEPEITDLQNENKETKK